MLKIILGVLVGFVVWSILWVGSDQILIATLGWYGAHQADFANAMANKTPFAPNITFLLMNLIRSVIISLISGYIAAAVAKENTRSTLALGVLLLAFGAMVELIAWNYLPVWYHFLFLFLLIPVTIAGGKMKKFG
jgi:uncharacterized membrane protein YeaQ/YmgE (transglycosylase-associated protein family)